MTNVEKDIEKTRRKPLSEEKLKELLLKLRKNATGTLTFGKLVNVVDAIGWQIEGTLGWVPIHYEARGDKEAMPILIPRDRFSSEEQYEGKRQDLVDASLDELPSSPSQVGERAIMNVSPMKGDVGDDRYRYFTHDEWRGVEAVVVSSSSGAVSDPILPSRYDVENRGRDLSPNVLVNDTWAWMRRNGVEETIGQLLGLGVHVPASERTRENTGTCPVCWGNYKLEGDGTLVMHGYRRPGYGFIQGKCFAVGYEPVEISFKGLVAFQNELNESLSLTEEELEAAESGKVTQIAGCRGEVIKPGQPSFEPLLRDMIKAHKRQIELLKSEIENYAKLISAWKPRPMPKEGEPQRGMGYFLK